MSEPGSDLRFAIRFDPWMVGILALVGIPRRRSFVTLGATHFDVQFGWAHFRFARAWVAGVNRVGGSWRYGIGLHSNCVDWLCVNGSLAGLVEVRFSPPPRVWLIVPVRCRRLIVSLDDPDGFVAALTSPGVSA